ncbi:kinase-like domain-containing protein [Syncephalis plumigaleata]|nr:kinase-like domain-containing protein [Syncephalis plumigaleata]
MPIYSREHSRLSLRSTPWLSAEYYIVGDTTPVDDFYPFVVHSYEPDIGESNAFGYSGLVVEKKRTSRYSIDDYSAYVTYNGEPGFFKCTYIVETYANEIATLSKLNKLDLSMPTIPPWQGYSEPIPFRNTTTQLLTYFRTADGYGCTAFHLIDGVQLNDYVKHMDLQEKDTALREVARQLIIRWIHGDVKPKNILVKQLSSELADKPSIQVVLVDFNFAVSITGNHAHSYYYSGVVSPPEFFVSRYKYARVSDSWALGATLYAAFTGRLPYMAYYDEDGNEYTWSKAKRMKVMRELRETQQHQYASLNCSEQAHDFITRLMEIDPTKRPTLSEIMWHEWLE